MAPLAPTWTYIAGIVSKVMTLARMPDSKKSRLKRAVPARDSIPGPMMIKVKRLKRMCGKLACMKIGVTSRQYSPSLMRKLTPLREVKISMLGRAVAANRMAQIAAIRLTAG